MSSYLKSQDIDYLVCLKFDEKLSQLEADDFVKTILVDGFNTSHLVIGDDFRFGKNRAGDFQLLRDRGREFGFDVEQVPALPKVLYGCVDCLHWRSHVSPCSSGR